MQSKKSFQGFGRAMSALLLMGALSAVSACGTIEGAGKDLEAAGGAISDTARDTKRKMSD
ncbi:MAG: entericidin A/B family lipoprotein [Magnetospiraceae bacterium]